MHLVDTSQHGDKLSFEFHSSEAFDTIEDKVRTQMSCGMSNNLLITKDMRYRGDEAAALFQSLHFILFCLEHPLLAPNGDYEVVNMLINNHEGKN